MEPRIKLKNIFKHFHKICTHKKWVFRYCREASITWRGIKHDLSKFSPTEFWESVRYYQGDSSPIDAAKKDKGWSKAWMHHKGRNSHHYEYWMDNFDNGGEALIMPFDDALELLCDYLAAGRAYMGKGFSYTAEYQWWRGKQSKPLKMHPVVQWFVSTTLADLAEMEQCGFDPLADFEYRLLKRRYDELVSRYKKEGHL